MICCLAQYEHLEIQIYIFVSYLRIQHFFNDSIYEINVPSLYKIQLIYYNILDSSGVLIKLIRRILNYEI